MNMYYSIKFLDWDITCDNICPTNEKVCINSSIFHTKFFFPAFKFIFVKFYITRKINTAAVPGYKLLVDPVVVTFYVDKLVGIILLKC